MGRELKHFLRAVLAASLGGEPVFVKTSWPRLMADLAEDRFERAVGGISMDLAR